MREYALCAFLAAAVTYMTTPLAREWAVVAGAMAEVRDRDIHSTPTPRFGGLALFMGVLAAFALGSQIPRLAPAFEPDQARQLWTIVLAMCVVTAVGMVDDRWGIDPLTKMSGQVLAGGLVAYGGTSLSWIPTPGGVLVLDPFTSVLSTVFLVVFTVNAMNFVDGLDGLAAGLAGISALGFFAYAYLLSGINGLERAQLATLIAVVVVGVCAGFLPHNFFRARVFMGDTGSMLLGLLLAVCSITLLGRVDPNAVGAATLAPVWLPLVIPLAALALPIADLLLAVGRRTWAGRSPFTPDKGHLHHLIVERMPSQRVAVLVLYGWAALLAGATVAIAFAPVEWVLAVSIALFGCLVMAIARLSRPAERPPRDGAAVVGGAPERGKLRSIKKWN